MPPPPPPRGGAGARPLVLRAPAHHVALRRRRLLLLPALHARLHARLRVRRGLESGGNERDRDLALRELDRGVHHGAEDDQRARVDELVDHLGGFVHLVQRQVLAARDVPHDAGGAVDAEVEQRRGDGGGGRLACAVLARGATDAHQRRARVRHHGAHVGEVHVDQPGERDDIADAAHALAQDVVRQEERVLHRQRSVHRGEQAVVGDDDQRVDVAPQPLHRVHGLVVPLAALELERHRHNADGEDAGGFRDARHNRRRAGAGAAAHARGDEHHVRAGEGLLDGLPALLRGLLADLGVAAGAEAARQLLTHLDVTTVRDRRGGHGLGIGVDDPELDAVDVAADHAVHGVGATAADADDLRR